MREGGDAGRGDAAELTGPDTDEHGGGPAGQDGQPSHADDRSGPASRLLRHLITHSPQTVTPPTSGSYPPAGTGVTAPAAVQGPG